jgi:hypothetical protein
VDYRKERKEVQEEPIIEPIINGPFRVKNLKYFRNSMLNGHKIRMENVSNL